MDYYDLIIVGAGPTGLALAHCCANLNKSILVIDREEVIGGCHRVKRVDGLFTEHGPRVYLSNSLNFFHLIQEIGLNKNQIFVPYTQTDYSKLLSYFTWNELSVFLATYFKYILNNDYGIHTSLKTFCAKKGYTPKAIDAIDKLCRYIDGAGIDRYSLNKLLKIIDSTSSILQPKAPLDNILFRPWQKYLTSHNVDFMLGLEINHINYNKEANKIDYITINNKNIRLDKLILAIPPSSL